MYYGEITAVCFKMQTVIKMYSVGRMQSMLLLSVVVHKGTGALMGCIPGVLISPYPDLLPDVVCLMVRIFRLMLVLLYIYIYIYSNNIPPSMIINRIYENQNLLSL
jgi:hypothetical protein